MSNKATPEAADKAAPDQPQAEAPKSTGRKVEDFTDEAPASAISSPYDRKPKVKRSERNGRVVENYL